jgi:hypothetical protein
MIRKENLNMQNIFIELMPPWVETGIQPAFYDKESGTVLQQVARMYAKVNYLVEMFNKFSKDTTDYVNEFVDDTNTEIARFEHETTETVNDYIARFVALKDFVDDYFENLDVQEEINNKLDDMLEQGTLQEIITTYIQSNVKWTFDNVSSMKLATNFVNGSFATTLGFYSRNDNGGATYKIRTKTVDDTADEMTLIALYDNTLIAELVKTEVMNVKQFGAKGDGETDDTAKIQKAVDTCKTITVPAGTYMINAITHINLNSDNKLILDNSATLKAITNSETSYAVIWIENVSDVEVTGGTIEGEKLTHTGTEGEWGHCIRLYGTADRIYIHDINLINAWGDGICCKISGAINTARVHVDGARRNGYSVAKCTAFISNDDFIENTGGTAPGRGVDVEPDQPTEYLKNVVFNNLNVKNSANAGFGAYLMNAGTDPIDIVINNLHDDGSSVGVYIAKNNTTSGKIVLNNPYLVNNGDSAIRLWKCYDSNCAVKIIHPCIINSNTNAQGVLYGAGICGYVLDSDTDLPLGNIEIIEPYIDNNGTPVSSNIYFRHYGTSNPGINNVKVVDPIFLDGGKTYITVNTNTFFSDKYDILHFSTDSNYTLPASEYYSLYTNRSTTSNNRILTIGDNMEVGRKIKIRNMNSEHTLSAKLPENHYCYELSETASPRIILPKIGDTIELQYIGDATWIITEINCTPTVS